MRREFIQLARAWYGDTVVNMRDILDDLTIHVFDDQAFIGEFGIEWVYLNGRSVPRLVVFNDGWRALAWCDDLIQRLGELNGQDVPPASLAVVLGELGFDDVTPTERD